MLSIKAGGGGVVECEDRLYTSEYDVCRRQNLTFKDGLHTERINIFLMTIDP